MRAIKRFLVLLVAIAAVLVLAPFIVITVHRIVPWPANLRAQGLDWVFTVIGCGSPFFIYPIAQLCDWTGHVADRIRLPRRPVPLDELKERSQKGTREDVRRAIS